MLPVSLLNVNPDKAVQVTSKQEKPQKARVDQQLVDRGLVESRTRAQALILAGKIYSDTKRIEKAGDKILTTAPLSVKGQDHPWVSRGGLKLDKAISHFNLSATERVCLDVGASTGGFSDVLLHHGAKQVYAVDVGHGQLAWKLRQDPRIIVMEKTNARYLDRTAIPDPIDAIVCDASFISLKTVLPAALSLANPGCWAAALIKPQFEVGRNQVGKGGVVRDPALHQSCCDMIEAWWQDLPGWQIQGITESPITGPEGNKEFLIVSSFSG